MITFKTDFEIPIGCYNWLDLKCKTGYQYLLNCKIKPVESMHPISQVVLLFRTFITKRRKGSKRLSTSSPPTILRAKKLWRLMQRKRDALLQSIFNGCVRIQKWVCITQFPNSNSLNPHLICPFSPQLCHISGIVAIRNWKWDPCAFMERNTYVPWCITVMS